MRAFVSDEDKQYGVYQAIWRAILERGLSDGPAAKAVAWRLCHLAGDELLHLANHSDAFRDAVKEAHVHMRVERFGRVTRESSPGEVGVPAARLGEAIPEDEEPTEEEFYPPEIWGTRTMFMGVWGVWLEGVDGRDYFVSWEAENPGAFFRHEDVQCWVFDEEWGEYGEFHREGEEEEEAREDEEEEWPEGDDDDGGDDDRPDRGGASASSAGGPESALQPKQEEEEEEPEPAPASRGASPVGVSRLPRRSRRAARELALGEGIA